MVEYKGFAFIRPPKEEDLTPYFHAIDWAEAHAIVQPQKTCEILIKPAAIRLYGLFDPVRNRIYLYRNENMSAILVHELVHLWQWSHWDKTKAEWNSDPTLEPQARFYEDLYLTHLRNS